VNNELHNLTKQINMTWGRAATNKMGVMISLE